MEALLWQHSQDRQMKLQVMEEMICSKKIHYESFWFASPQLFVSFIYIQYAHHYKLGLVFFFTQFSLCLRLISGANKVFKSRRRRAGLVFQNLAFSG